MALHLSAPDRRNLLDVRSRLWQGRAALLAGAGVSRSASVPLHPDAPPLPLWLDLARAMAAGLYRDAGQSPAPLRLAQEYEAAFGRQAVLDLVARLVADQEHVPGPLHRALLGLPWADVFTTNYDTLLERTVPTGPARYHAVYLPSDLGRRPRPRIVKLHGSLPSHLPLVLTEEDYRTYAETRSSFTALVQTSLAENAVLLLGFSYDDPNFLAWSGTVRDHLGPHAPPVHLVGALDLPAHRRQLLEARGVRPVDLGPVFPLDEWPDPDHRHRAALAWTVATLAAGRPRHPLDWLSARLPGTPVDLPQGCADPLPASESPAVPAPRAPRPSVYPVSNPPPPPDLEAQWLAWRRERLDYPGWVVAPIDVQRALELQIELWGADVVGGAPGLDPVPRLGLLREYSWRHRASGIFLSDQEVRLCEDALGAVNPVPARLMLPDATVQLGQALAGGVSWTDVADDWADVALSVLSGARRAAEPETFEAWSTLLDRLDLQPSQRARLHYERCRMALLQLDTASARNALGAWPATPNGFPFGLTWRACIQGELGDWAAAHQTATEALSHIQRAHGVVAQRSASLLSQEGWTRQLLTLTEQAVAEADRDYDRMLNVDFSWQRGLSEIGANPRDVLADLEASVETDPPAPKPSV